MLLAGRDSHGSTRFTLLKVNDFLPPQRVPRQELSRVAISGVNKTCSCVHWRGCVCRSCQVWLGPALHKIVLRQTLRLRVARTARFLAALLCLLLPAGSSMSQSAHPPSDEDVDRFVDGLLTRMTLSEKIGQMEQAAGQPAYTTPARAEELARSGRIGSFLFFTDPVRINALQHIAVEQSRLHIPILFGYDVIHGFRTIAPIPLAMASSWDPELAEHTQAMAAKEARAAGVDWAFSPMVDIARDARWGRIMESAGEDPFLGEAMAAAQV